VAGKLTTTFVPEGCTDAEAIVVDQRDIVDAQNAVVTIYPNPPNPKPWILSNEP
jgi:hypothetical protein